MTYDISQPNTPILIVDDNVQYAQILERLLKNGFGYSDISMVHSTEAAYGMVEKAPAKFKLLFVDYNFPSGNSGGEFLQKLKDAGLFDDKVAFLITSEPTLDNMKQALAAGARGVVAKPFDRQKIGEQLEKARRALMTENMESF